MLIENKFQYFFNEDYLIKDREVINFPLVKNDVFTDDVFTDDSSVNIIMRHTIYSIIFPHEIRKESINDDITQTTEKYIRRIDRFYDVCTNPEIKKVFIRITNKKDDYEKINNCLKKFAYNYELKIILIDKKTKYFDWKKDEIDWTSFI